MNCTAEKQLSHGVFESFEIRKDSFFTVPQCEDTAPIQIGEILNNTYQITRFIAQGGMGIVYEGIDLVLHRKVAIKVLVTDFDDEEYEKELKLFQTEINLCGNLRHPNIIQIYYSGIHHRLPYLVMEYIDGIPINEYVMKQRRFNWNQKVKLISQVANGLAYIHKNNILHRDIKPSNILVTADGTPVLIDFGISIKKNLATIATNEGELSGTIRYMSPEQVTGECDQIDERSDIYSLGLILYEILTKHPAYTGSPNEIIGQIFNSSLLPPSDVNINISETLSNITMKAIAKEPEDRYSTATEFIEDLRLYLKNENKKRVVQKVSLFEKVYYYLKPNKKIAVALGCIMIFFMAKAILNIAAFRDTTILNIVAFRDTTIGEMIFNLLPGIKPYLSGDVPGKTQRPIQTEQIKEANIKFENTIEPKTGQNSNNTLDSQDASQKLALNIKSQQEKTNPEDVDTIEDTAQVTKNTTETHNGKVTDNPGSSKPVSPNVEKPVKPVKPSPDDDEDNPYIPGSEKNRNREEFSVAYLVPNTVQDSVSTEESSFQNEIFREFTVVYYLIENSSLVAITRGAIESWVHKKTGMKFYPIKGNDKFVRERNGAFFKNQWDDMDSQNSESSSVLLISKPITQKIWFSVMNTKPWQDLDMQDDDDSPVIGYTEEDKQQFIKKLSFKYKDQSNKERIISPQCFSLSLLAKLQAEEIEESSEETKEVRPIIIIPKDEQYNSSKEKLLATVGFEKSNPIEIKPREYQCFVYNRINKKFILEEEDNQTGVAFLVAHDKCSKSDFQQVRNPISGSGLGQVVSVLDCSTVSTGPIPTGKLRPVITIPKDTQNDVITQIMESELFEELDTTTFRYKRENDENFENRDDLDMTFYLKEREEGSEAFLIANDQYSRGDWSNIMERISKKLKIQDFLHLTPPTPGPIISHGSKKIFKPIVIIPCEESYKNSMTILRDEILNTGKFVEVPSIEGNESEFCVHAPTGIEFIIVEEKTTGFPFLVARNDNDWKGKDAEKASQMILEDCKNFCEKTELLNPYHILNLNDGSKITLYK
jgi:serine/threonine protein kinase